MDLEQIQAEFSKQGIKPRDYVVVNTNGYQFEGRLIPKTLIKPVSQKEITGLVHTKDNRLCICLKMRPDGVGPDIADSVVFVEDITNIKKTNP
jgi:hypothetical protein